MDTLGAIIKRQMAAVSRVEGRSTNISMREVARRISGDPDGNQHHTISRYINGRFRTGDGLRLLPELSEALSSPDCPPAQLLREMQEAAGLPVGEGTRFVMPPELNALDSREREALIEMGRVLLAAKWRAGGASRAGRRRDATPSDVSSPEDRTAEQQ